ACRQLPLPDGTACENVCLQGATCQQGRCVGKPRSCDDGNVCTADSCDPVQGCRHADTTAHCPAPGSPCRVATCDPSSGCGERDAPDHTPCGTVSCAEARLCFAGSCVPFEPPEGFPCAPPTPCRGAGTCRARQCELPAPGALTRSWTYVPTERHFLAHLHLADAAGNVYLSEQALALPEQDCEALYSGSPQDAQRCAEDARDRRYRLVSLTPTGAVRWSVAGSGTFRPVLVDHDRLWAHVEDGLLVLNAADGTRVAASTAMVDRLASGDRIVVGMRWLPGTGGVVLSAFDATTGRNLWSQVHAGDSAYVYGYAMVLEADRILLVLRRLVQGAAAGELVLLDASGRELSRQPGPEVIPALLPTRAFPVFHAAPFQLTGFDARASRFEWRRDYLAGTTGGIGPVVGEASALFAPIDEHVGGVRTTRSVEARRLSDGAALWKTTLPSDGMVDDVWVTDRHSLLVEQTGATGHLLSELRKSDGSLLYTCPVPELADIAFVGRGRAWVNDNGQVGAYVLPNVGLAGSGWVSRDGNPGRSQRPR
ncbi:MAG: PQQ-binding-like beta-propeller repeat protein, partial [Myxococcales bacterium]